MRAPGRGKDSLAEIGEVIDGGIVRGFRRSYAGLALGAPRSRFVGFGERKRGPRLRHTSRCSGFFRIWRSSAALQCSHDGNRCPSGPLSVSAWGSQGRRAKYQLFGMVIVLAGRLVGIERPGECLREVKQFGIRGDTDSATRIGPQNARAG